MADANKDILAGVLTIREYAMRESLPLATLQEGVFDFLRGRTDAVVFGAQAVNAYVDEPRMSQDIDLQSTRAAELSEELRAYLAERFHIAMRVRSVADGQGFRLYQVREGGNRHLIYIRSVDALPPGKEFQGIMIASPEELIAGKAIACHRRRNQPKSGTDWRDLLMLLLAFPDLKQQVGAVSRRLAELGAEAQVLELWNRAVSQEMTEDDDEGEFV